METELETLVIRLVGDVEGYVKALKESQAATADAAEQVKDFNETLTAVVGTVAALGAGAFLKQALGEFQQAELAALKLNTALSINGRQVERLTTRYGEFALRIEALTTAEDDATLSAIATAEMLGVTGAAAERATKNAIALSAQFGGAAESYIRMTAALEKGDTMMLQRLLRGQLSHIKDDAERAAKAQEILGKMFAQAEAQAKSSSGSLEKLSRDYGNALEDLGKYVADGLKPAVELTSKLIAGFRELPDWIKLVTVGLVALTAGFVAVATTLPLVASGFASVTAAVSSLTVALATNPMTAWIVAAGLLATGLVVLGDRAIKTSREMQQLKEVLDQRHKITEKLVQETAKMDLSSAEDSVEKWTERLKQANEEMDKAQGLFGSWRMTKEAKANIEEATKMLEAARDRAKQLREELSVDEAKRWEMTQEEELADAERQARTFDAAQEQINKRFEEGTKWLEDYNAEMQKMNADQLAAEIEDANRRAEESFAKSDAMKRSLRTPAEIMADELEEIKKMENQLGPEFTKRALDKLVKGFSETEKQVKQTRNEIERFDHVLAGSAEAGRRIRQTVEISQGERSRMSVTVARDPKETAILDRIKLAVEEMARKGGFKLAGL